MAKQPLFYILTLLSLLFITSLLLPITSSSPHFEGFDEDDLETSDTPLPDLPRRPPPPTTLSTSPHPQSPPSSPSPKPIIIPPSSFDFWDEDEFEGFTSPEHATVAPEDNIITPDDNNNITDGKNDGVTVDPVKKTIGSFTVEIICLLVLVLFGVNYYYGRKENEALALSWAARFATSDTIFDKNFSLLGVGAGEDSPLLLKEGQNVFKFYASGRRFCESVLGTMELKSRHDLLARVYNMVVPCRDEITFEVYMNEDAMDHVVFALGKRKVVKGMQKEVRDLQRFGSLMAAPSNRKWVADELAVVTESKEVAGDLITEAVLDQVFGERAFEKFGKLFISMHFSDQHPSSHRRVLIFKFALPAADHMADMTRLVALIPYYIDLIGRYKLSSQARTKPEAARAKLAQEVYKELQYARQDAIQRKKAEKKKMMEEAALKLNAEALRKKEAKERARQMKKAMPKIKMSRGG